MLHYIHTQIPRTIIVFIAYALKDEELEKKLEQQLNILINQGLDISFNSKIIAGTEWEQENEDRLISADVILLLISPDFLESDYCYTNQIEQAVERHKNKQACVIPILLRSCLWDRTPFAKLQTLPKDRRFVTERARDRAFRDISFGIRESVEELQKHLFGNRSDANGVG